MIGRPQFEKVATIPQPVFHNPQHDHARCAADALAEADAVCAKRGARLTSTRRRVLEILLSGHRPIGAYEIIDHLAADGSRPAPITVYRALDFLLEQGLVHRLASRNAFMACIHQHAATDKVVFLICEQCGAVGEVSSARIMRTIDEAAAAAGFMPKAPVVEVSGLCAHCQSDAPART
jgi:Fur family transcriptional regulator, zinc uptake regulator